MQFVFLQSSLLLEENQVYAVKQNCIGTKINLRELNNSQNTVLYNLIFIQTMRNLLKQSKSQNTLRNETVRKVNLLNIALPKDLNIIKVFLDQSSS